MYAKPGDWLLVHSHSDSRHARRAEILSVGDAGGPPYRVRWLDTGHEGLVFPGPDAAVVTAEEQVELDRAETDRAAQTLESITQGRGTWRPGH